MRSTNQNVLQIGGADILFGLVGREQTQIIHHVLASMQGLAPLLHNLLNPKNEACRLKNQNQKQNKGACKQRTWSTADSVASAWILRASSKSAGNGKSSILRQDFDSLRWLFVLFANLKQSLRRKIEVGRNIENARKKKWNFLSVVLYVQGYTIHTLHMHPRVKPRHFKHDLDILTLLF